MDPLAQEEAYGQQIRSLYEKVEIKLVKAVRDRLASGAKLSDEDWVIRKLAELRALNREINQIIADDLEARIPAEIQTLLDQAYRDAVQAAGEQLIRSNLPDLSAGLAVGRAGAVRAIARKVTGALAATHLRITREARDVYYQAILRVQEGLVTGTPRIKTTQRILSDFATKGISGFRDRAGRNWDLGSYAEMAARTGTGQAQMQGHVDKLVAAGYDLAMIPAMPETCKACAAWEGKIVSLTGKTPGYPTLDDAIADGLGHPNCGHRSPSPWIPGLTIPPVITQSPEEQEEIYRERQRQRYLERGVRQWKRREVAALDDAERARCRRKVLDWQAELRQFCNETGRRRLPEREALWQGYRKQGGGREDAL